MQIDELQDAAKQVVIIQEEKLDDDGNILSLEQEAFALWKRIVTLVLGLAHAEIEDGERKDRQVDGLWVFFKDPSIFDRMGVVDLLVLSHHASIDVICVEICLWVMVRTFDFQKFLL